MTRLPRKPFLFCVLWNVREVYGEGLLFDMVFAISDAFRSRRGSNSLQQNELEEMKSKMPSRTRHEKPLRAAKHMTRLTRS